MFVCGVLDWHGVERYARMISFSAFVIVGAFVAIPRLTLFHEYILSMRLLRRTEDLALS